MPSDKHNSRTARARDLISSLINVASSWDVPFHQPKLLQCLHQGATFVPLWSPTLSSQPRKVMICGRHVMASVITDCWGTPHTMPCLLCYETSSTLLKSRYYGFHISRYGCVFHKLILRIFCNGWVDCRDTFYVVLCLYCCVTDRT